MEDFVKPYKKLGYMELYAMTYECPRCKTDEYELSLYELFNFCPNCGVKVEWDKTGECRRVENGTENTD